MAQFTYKLQVGSYDTRVRAEVEFKIDGAAVDNEEYVKLCNAFDEIEEIARKYQKELDVTPVVN